MENPHVIMLIMDKGYLKVGPCAMIKTIKLIELVYSTHNRFSLCI